MKPNNKTKLRGEEGGITFTWKDLVDPKDRRYVKPDVDNMKPFDRAKQQAPQDGDEG